MDLRSWLDSVHAGASTFAGVFEKKGGRSLADLAEFNVNDFGPIKKALISDGCGLHAAKQLLDAIKALPRVAHVHEALAGRPDPHLVPHVCCLKMCVDGRCLPRGMWITGSKIFSMQLTQEALCNSQGRSN